MLKLGELALSRYSSFLLVATADIDSEDWRRF